MYNSTDKHDYSVPKTNICAPASVCALSRSSNFNNSRMDGFSFSQVISVDQTEQN